MKKLIKFTKKHKKVIIGSLLVLLPLIASALDNVLFNKVVNVVLTYFEYIKSIIINI